MQPTPHSHAAKKKKNDSELKTLPNHTKQLGRRDATSNASNREKHHPHQKQKQTHSNTTNKQHNTYKILTLETRVQHPNARCSHTLDHPHRRLIKRIKISHTSTPIWRIVTSISMLQQERRVQIPRRATTIRETVRTLPQWFLHVLPGHMIILGRTKHQIHIMPRPELPLARRKEATWTTVLHALTIPFTALTSLITILLARNDNWFGFLRPCGNAHVLRDKHVTMRAQTVRGLIISVSSVRSVLTAQLVIHACKTQVPLRSDPALSSPADRTISIIIRWVGSAARTLHGTLHSSLFLFLLERRTVVPLAKIPLLNIMPVLSRHRIRRRSNIQSHSPGFRPIVPRSSVILILW